MSNGQTGFYGTKPLCSCLVGESQSVGLRMIGSASDRTVMRSAQETQRAAQAWGWSASRSRSDGHESVGFTRQSLLSPRASSPRSSPWPSLCAIRSGAQKSEQWRHRRPAATEILSLRPRTAVATAGTTGVKPSPQASADGLDLLPSVRGSTWLLQGARAGPIWPPRGSWKPFHSGVQVDQPPAGTLQGWP